MFDIAVTNSQENKFLTQVLAMSLGGFIGDIAMNKPKGFKDIPLFEGKYYASRNGEIWSGCLTHKSKKHKGILLKQDKTPLGYHRVKLILKGKRINYKVHRLIALTFIDNPEKKEHINHKNLNKSDNRASNLEWCTIQENIAHYHKNKNKEQ